MSFVIPKDDESNISFVINGISGLVRLCLTSASNSCTEADRRDFAKGKTEISLGFCLRMRHFTAAIFAAVTFEAAHI